MNKWLLIGLAIILLLYPFPAQAAADGDALLHVWLKKTAAEVCPRFAKNPQAFQPVTEKDMVPCVVYGAPYAPKGEGVEGQCYMGKVWGEAEPVKLHVVSGTGMCQSSSVARVAEGDNPSIRWFDMPNVGVNGYGMGRYDKILKTYGHYTLVTDDRASDLRVLTKDGAYVLCGFINKLHGYTVDRWKNASVCEKFANDDFTVPETPRGSDVEGIRAADALYGGQLERETHVEAISEVDLDGDGVVEKLLRIQKSSGAHCGCTQSRMGLAAETVAARGDIDTMQKKLETLTAFGSADCHSQDRWSIAMIEGKAYIARNAGQAFEPNEARRRRLTLSTTPFGDRILYEYVEGRFAEVCRLKPDSVRYIDRDILGEGELNYTPVE
jgi:hypothetical protein